MKNDFELQRIENDLAKARDRLAQLRATSPPTVEANAKHDGLGAPLAWHAAQSTNLPNGEHQWRRQIAAREADITRLESELLAGMLAEGQTTAGKVLAALEHVCAPSRLVVQAAAVGAALRGVDPIRAKLQALLDAPGIVFYLPKSKLQALLAEQE